MSLPPLIFSGEDKLEHWQPVSLGVNANERKPTGFPRGIFECFGSPLVGFDCCMGIVCCGPITWSNSVRLAGVDAQAAALATLVAAWSRDGHGNQSAIGQAAGCFAAFTSAEKRQELIRRLYPNVYFEGYCTSLFYHVCCMGCAYAQEIDAVAAHVEATRGIKLRYGPTTRCMCTQLMPADDPLAMYREAPTGAPRPQTMASARGPNLLGLSSNALSGDNGYYAKVRT